MRAIHDKIEDALANRKDALGKDFTWSDIVRLGIETAEKIVAKKQVGK